MLPQHLQYLESKVLTASPPRLHLMLVEGALRFGRQAEAELNAGNPAGAVEPLGRLLDIAGELLAGVRQAKSEVNGKLAALYWFVFRRASEATMNSSSTALADVMRVLELERQTWQQVCEKLNSGKATATAPPPAMLTMGRTAAPVSGISLQA